MGKRNGGTSVGAAVERVVLRGITWEHRRAIDPLTSTLDAYRRRHPETAVSWDARPLHGFEFTPVEELARRYDMIILDHPFVGSISATDCLLPLDDLIDDDLRDAFVGPSLETYRYAGRLWALPVDAACQVAVLRPDLLALCDAAVPRSWESAFALGEQAARKGLRLAIAFAGVHGLMTFFTLCANLGRPCATDPALPLVERSAAVRALAAMRRLLSFCPPQAVDWNSIALHDAMVARDDLVYCPAVYCYAAYAEADLRRRLAFADLPGLGHDSPAGSTIGGTGIGVSARTRHPDTALAYVRFLMERETQRAFAANHGQPARRDIWLDPAIDRRFGQCFSNTLRTVEAAWVRPRYAGYLTFQKRGGDLVEAHLRGALAEDRLLDRLEALHAACGVP